MYNTFIGIDPGQSGGFAIIDEDRVETYPWNDENFNAIAHLSLIGGGCPIAFIEKVSAMPKQGVTSMFNFGKSAGFIEGVLAAMNIPYQLVPPQTWKKEYSLGKDKEDSIKVCERLFPTVNLLRTDRCTKKHDGMAEALLIAEYARRKAGTI